jgi:hypothetical protein
MLGPEVTRRAIGLAGRCGGGAAGRSGGCGTRAPRGLDSCSPVSVVGLRALSGDGRRARAAADHRLKKYVGWSKPAIGTPSGAATQGDGFRQQSAGGGTVAGGQVFPHASTLLGRLLPGNVFAVAVGLAVFLSRASGSFVLTRAWLANAGKDTAEAHAVPGRRPPSGRAEAGGGGIPVSARTLAGQPGEPAIAAP